MPKAENLNKPGKPNKPNKSETHYEKQPIKKSETGTFADSLVPTSPPVLIESKDEQKVASVKLPDFLKTSEMPEIAGSNLTGYIGFAHPMSKNWGMMQAAGIEEGMPFLNVNKQFIKAAPTLEFFLCRGESFKSKMNDRGKFIYVTWDLATVDVSGPIINTNRQTGQRTVIIPDGGKVTLEPHYITLLIVNLNGQLIPIKGDFRGTKSGGIETCIRAVEAAGTPEWGKLSDLHKISNTFPQPFGRVYHIIRTKHNVGKVSGRPYFTSHATSHPSSVSQMQLLASAFENEDFVDQLNEANSNYNKRIEFMEDIANNGPSD